MIYNLALLAIGFGAGVVLTAYWGFEVWFKQPDPIVIRRVERVIVIPGPSLDRPAEPCEEHFWKAALFEEEA